MFEPGDVVQLETLELAYIVEAFVYVEPNQIREMLEIKIKGRQVEIPLWSAKLVPA